MLVRTKLDDSAMTNSGTGRESFEVTKLVKAVPNEYIVSLKQEENRIEIRMDERTFATLANTLRGYSINIPPTGA